MGIRFPKAHQCALLLGALTLARFGWAQADAAAAEALFRDGRQLMDQKQYAQACPKLAESQRLDPATGTLLALAMCHEGEGKFASAWAEYNDVVSRANRDGRADREQAARERAQALEPKLSKLAVAVDAGTQGLPGLEVKRDGLVLASAAWVSPIPVDPGEHTIEASAPGRQPWKGTVLIGGELDNKRIVVPLLAEAPKQAAQPQAAGSKGPESAPPVSKASRPRYSAGLVVGALGVVGLGVGTAFGIRAVTKNSESNTSGCVDNACPPDAKQARLDAIKAANTATVAFVAGGALVAGGITLLVVGSEHGEARPQARLSVTGPGAMRGILLDGKF